MKRNLKKINCKICGFETTTNGLATHIKFKHSIATDEYINKFGEFRPKYLNYIDRANTDAYMCKICNEKCASERHLTFHIKLQHVLSKRDYIIQYILNGEIPKCKCGCGEPIKIIEKGSDYYRKYISGHNATFNHTGTFRTTESKMKMRKSAIERMKVGKSVFFESGTSKAEIELLEYIKTIYCGEVENKNTTILSGNELDVYIPKLQLAIELNGERFHSDLFKKNSYHLRKTKECNQFGIKLIHIWLSDWYSKKEIIKSQLKCLLGNITNKIYARDCEIKEIDNETAGVFLNRCHLQGTIISKIRYGLFYKGQIVQVMNFGKLRNVTNRTHKSGSFELLRMCSELNTIVVGGASKLFSFFIKNNNPDYIISFANRDWSMGNTYNKLGMQFAKHTAPGYFYSKGKQRYHRYKFQKHKLVSMGYDKTKTEYEIMTDLGYYRVWNTGNIIYEWKKDL